jgi:hypothetical protein
MKGKRSKSGYTLSLMEKGNGKNEIFRAVIEQMKEWVHIVRT